MGEYLGFLVAASAVVALGGLMAHGGRSLGAVKLALGVMLLSASVVPIVSAVAGVVEDGKEIFSEGVVPDGFSGTLYEKTAEEAFSDGVKKLVVSEFSLSVDDVDVRVHGFDVQNVRAEVIKVILSGKAAYADHKSIKLRIEELLLGKCEVELEFN